MRKRLLGFTRRTGFLGFAPADPTSLGLARLLVGGWLVAASRDFGPGGILRLVILLSFTVGLCSRTTALLAGLWVLIAGRPGTGMSLGFNAVSVLVLCLAVSGASGQAVSLDRFGARWRQNRRALARRPEQPWEPPSGVPEPTLAADLGRRLIQVTLGGIAIHGVIAGVRTASAVALVVGSVTFLSGTWWRRLITGRPEDQPAGRVLFDGACPRCRASMALVAAADPDHVVAPVDLTAVDVADVHPSLTCAACLQAMHLVQHDGRVRAGYDAVLTLARWLPLFWPLALLGSIPGVAPLGRRVYNTMAARRVREGPCTDVTCAIHRPSSQTPRTSGPLP